MSAKTILAGRYARALLTLGVEDGRYDQYGRELGQLAGSLAAAGSEASRALLSPVYPRQMRKGILKAVLAQADLSPLVENFLDLLLEKGRLGDLETIVEVYGRMVDEQNGLVRGTLVSAAPLDELEVEAIKTALGAFAGRRVELKVSQDPGIIGGLVARLGDLTIDGSVRTQLNKLARSLEKREG